MQPEAFSISGRKSGTTIAAGIACGVGAGALWGLVFLVPAILHAFGPFQIAIGRYATYGLLAAAIIGRRWPALLRKLDRRDWLTLAGLSLCGNTAHYVFLTVAVKLGGVPMTSLVIGFLPVVVTVIGSREQGAVPLAKLIPSVLFSVAGMVAISWQTLVYGEGERSWDQLMALLCAIVALATWAVFAVWNGRTLHRLDHVSSQEWSLLTGVTSGLEALLLIPAALLFERTSHSTGDWLNFLFVCSSVALFSSIIGFALWNRMSRLLPMTMVGQMILFETFFALLYGFLWDHRLPAILETAAILFLFSSVASSVAAHQAERS
ncbi:DMT family transporter [Novosphingobium sp. PhB55]|uniref:DMT family transporter n=1 Tax=unclassified Novosphingobium TaxID=2644732 RepID=UPI00106496B7|nr:DMT family transporter [Novosphingobium sp. PhB55]TDW67607.1 drug/metabolite transporter (DMT)-like permease [Novosphingobium sp. PhB55]